MGARRLLSGLLLLLSTILLLLLQNACIVWIHGCRARNFHLGATSDDVAVLLVNDGLVVVTRVSTRHGRTYVVRGSNAKRIHG